MDRQRTRRTVLRATAAVGVPAVLAGCGGPGEEGDPDIEAEEGTGNGQDREDEINETDEEDDSGQPGSDSG